MLRVILIAALLGATGQKMSGMSPTSDISNTRITPLGGSQRVMKNVMATVLAYDIMIFISGKPSANQVVARMKMSRAVTIPVALAGTQVDAVIDPTAVATVTIKKNDSAVGSIIFDPNGTTSFVAASPIALSTGDILSVHAPTVADSTLSDVAITLVGVSQ